MYGSTKELYVQQGRQTRRVSRSERERELWRDENEQISSTVAAHSAWPAWLGIGSRSNSKQNFHWLLSYDASCGCPGAPETADPSCVWMRREPKFCYHARTKTKTLSDVLGPKNELKNHASQSIKFSSGSTAADPPSVYVLFYALGYNYLSKLDQYTFASS